MYDLIDAPHCLNSTYTTSAAGTPSSLVVVVLSLLRRSDHGSCRLEMNNQRVNNLANITFSRHMKSIKHHNLNGSP